MSTVTLDQAGSSARSTPILQRAAISVALFVCGVLVFVLGTDYYSVFPTNESQAYRLVLAGGFLFAALLARRREHLRPYGDIAYAFFAATIGFFMTSLTVDLRDSLLRAWGIPLDAPSWPALGKLLESTLVLGVILGLLAFWRQGPASVYIRRGRLGLGLFVGGCMLTINTATGIVTGATLGYAGVDLLARLPWALLFSLVNALMEEVWLRGLFLGRFTKVIGVRGSILVTSVVFTLMHSAARYMNPVEAVLFQIIIFPMALLFGYLMHKTDSLWGSVLFHAGSDAFLFYLMGW